MVVKRDSGVDQEVNRVLSKHVVLKIKLEIELPTGTTFGKVAIFVGEG
jgi:hypothetical protein